MRCPYCKSDNDKVIDTCPSEDGHIIRRRRECVECKRRWTTHERLEETPIRVVKKSGQRVPFDPAKIRAGLNRALEKRPVSSEEIEKLADNIESQLMDRHNRDVESREIGALVMEGLRGLDDVAYVRFASVYREFKAVDEFVAEIRSISEGAGS